MAKRSCKATVDMFGPALHAPSTAVVVGFDEAAVAAMPETDLLALFANIGAIVARRCLKTQPVMSSWTAVVDYLRSTMIGETREQFRVLFLDKRNRLIADECMGHGTVDHVPVYPREVARRAIELQACALLLAHNHPSGDPTPSPADISMTKTLQDGLAFCGIVVHDHVIIGSAGHVSLRGQGLM